MTIYYINDVIYKLYDCLFRQYNYISLGYTKS